jgi:hypothetical protein
MKKKQKQEQKPNNPNLKKETNKRVRKKKEERTYYKFICKCKTGFDAFSDFLDHVTISHQIENLNFSEILAKKNESKWDIKFYWHLSCRCGHKFSSSLCNADLIVEKEQIVLLKKYVLCCLKCKEVALFDKEESLDEFLKERVKQKLIFSFYKEKFAQYTGESHSEKILEGHKQELCEKCKLLGRYCGENRYRGEGMN